MRFRKKPPPQRQEKEAEREEEASRSHPPEKGGRQKGKGDHQRLCHQNQKCHDPGRGLREGDSRKLVPRQREHGGVGDKEKQKNQKEEEERERYNPEDRKRLHSPLLFPRPPEIDRLPWNSEEDQAGQERRQGVKDKDLEKGSVKRDQKNRGGSEDRSRMARPLRPSRQPRKPVGPGETHGYRPQDRHHPPLGGSQKQLGQKSPRQ